MPAKKKTIRLLSGLVVLIVLSGIYLYYNYYTYQARARRIIEKTDVQGGLIAHVGFDNGKLISALHANDRYLVHGLSQDKNSVKKTRNYIHKKGLYGSVSVNYWKGGDLPYSDNLVNLLVVEEKAMKGMGEKEMMRVLRPNGIAYVRRDGEWNKRIKPWPEEIDEWTHYLHGPDNNAVARDSKVGPPRYLQWKGAPLFSRSHELDTSIPALVSAEGLIFYILDEGPIGIKDPRLPPKWSLVARDGFNGVILWKKPIPEWGWREWKKDELSGKDWTSIGGQMANSPIVLPRRLVAGEGKVYVTLGYNAPVTAIDAETGQTLQEFEGTAGTDEIIYSGDFLFLKGKYLLKDPGGKLPGQNLFWFSTPPAEKFSGRSRKIIFFPFL